MPQFFLGKVFSGSGEGKKFIILPWVREQIEEKMGFSPYPGTLNLSLTDKTAKKRETLRTLKAIRIEPKDGFYRGALYRALIKKLECAVVIPEVPNYPADTLEIIAPVYLRGQLGLKDGSLVRVVVNV